MKEIGPRIIIDPKIVVGKPVIKGTRITVELILRQLAQGRKAKEILEDYPHLKERDIQAAISHAAQLVGGERIYPFPSTLREKTKASPR
ncbi:MAG: DUF433 domain-containing protein [bacterium]|nr:DUF433 domain-containing protein [bacterium]